MVTVLVAVYFILIVLIMVDLSFSINGEIDDNASVVEFRIIIADLLEHFAEHEQHKGRMNG